MYNVTIEENGLDATGCEVPSAWVIVCYCSVLQVPLGSLCFLIYTIALLVKGLPAIGFAFPLKGSRCKKCLRGIPREDFARISDELADMGDVADDDWPAVAFDNEADGPSLLSNNNFRRSEYVTNYSFDSRLSPRSQGSNSFGLLEGAPVPTLTTTNLIED